MKKTFRFLWWTEWHFFKLKYLFIIINKNIKSGHYKTLRKKIFLSYYSHMRPIYSLNPSRILDEWGVNLIKILFRENQ